jgi:hypothetical protein
VRRGRRASARLARNAYEKLKDFSHALTDYINTIQLLGEPNRVAIDNFYDVSRMYAALNRHCDAITPIETFISFDPANRRTTQSTKLIVDTSRREAVTRVTLKALREFHGWRFLAWLD